MKKNLHNRNCLKYTPALRKFALTLKYYSSAATNIYNNILPHPRTLCRWYGAFDAEPGFTNEVFEVLKIKCKSSDKSLVCNLVFDEMAIRKQRLYHNQQKLGAVNFGAGPQDDDDDDNVASQALFMLVSLTENWKLPVCYFLITGVTAETKANLITTCLQKCHDAGISVVSLTFDGCSANLLAVEILGCKLTDPNNIVTYFPHPCTQEKVCIFLDTCHVIKLIRNTFEKNRLFLDEDGKKIR
jgi:DNA transposase THAP9